MNDRRQATWSVAALAAATLLLETTITRLLAVAQSYHFAFLVVSLALLGFGASGTLLSLAPRLGQIALRQLLAGAGIGFAAATGLAYAVVNLLPFDSYSIAWERRQILLFVLYYFALALPFLFGGLGIAAGLARNRGRSHLVYAANLAGSAVGVLLAPAALALAGVPGAVLASALLALIPALTWNAPDARSRGAATVPADENVANIAAFRSGSSRIPRATHDALLLFSAAGLVGLFILGALNLAGHGVVGLTISPYKGLAHARRYPGATVLFGRWNAISRVDVVGGAGTRLLPGLSYTYSGPGPEQHGLSVDADSVQPIPLTEATDFAAAAFLPEAAAFALRPGGDVLVLEPAGGLGVVQALAGGAGQVAAVVGNPLLRRAVAAIDPADPYGAPGVCTVSLPARAYLRGADAGDFDVVFLPLTDAYRPVASGAYSLAETYTLTAEAFEAMLARLAPRGILVATRWLQTPPSEDLRLMATVIEALEQRGVDPGAALVAYRGIQTLTVLAQPDGWRPDELAVVRAFAASRRYDLVWAPDIRSDEVNRFNRMPAAAHYQAVRDLLAAADRAVAYAAQPFAVAPATDDRPFFFHFFRWVQTPQVLATLGRTWQPFGGSGYLILFALLGLVLVLGGLLIVLPLVLRRKDLAFGPSSARRGAARARLRILGYFSLLGVAFLFVEIPLIQRWTLPFGSPTYAFTTVVLTLLAGSSLGSTWARARWLPGRAAVIGLALMALLGALAAPRLTAAVLGWPAGLRFVTLAVSLTPMAVLMGLPFPLGLARLEAAVPELVPWAWAVNGCASVVASVLAAILAISYGFTVVLSLGAAAYALAALLLPGET